MTRLRLWVARVILPRGYHVRRTAARKTTSRAQIPLPMPLTAA